ncbi:hypothetical protein BDC45DRAFT_467526 [Circinella umbellata]|nr:hypothetical protein BDC45DRAFT_467526 [Circinella umbellata]
MTRPPSPTAQKTETSSSISPSRVGGLTTIVTSTSNTTLSPLSSNMSTTTPAIIEMTSNNSNSNSSSCSTKPTGTSTTSTPSFSFIPRTYNHHQQVPNNTSSFGQRFKATLPFPRLYSGPLFAAPSVSVNNTHIVSSIGPLTPPLTIDHSTSSPIPSCSRSDELINSNSNSNNDSNSHDSNNESIQPEQTTTTVPASSPASSSSVSLLPSSPKRQKFNSYDVVHDGYRYMFRITLDNKGTIAALCYLPTRFQRMVEFYHTEIPTAYRDLGLGDLLVIQGFRWAETAKLLVIPTCPFVRRYLAKNNTSWDCVVQNENEGLARLLTPPSSKDTLTNNSVE